MTDWAVINNKVVVTVTLPNGETLALSKEQANRLGLEILKAVRSSPDR